MGLVEAIAIYTKALAGVKYANPTMSGKNGMMHFDKSIEQYLRYLAGTCRYLACVTKFNSVDD